MSKSVNSVTLLGRLGKDAETKFTPNGAAVSNFSIATDRRVKKGDDWTNEAEWTNVVVWKSESLGQYLLKGKQIYLQGRLQTRSWEDKEGKKQYRTEVVCDAVNVILLSGGDRSDEVVSRPRSAQADRSWENSPPVQTPRQAFGSGASESDDVPF